MILNRKIGTHYFLFFLLSLCACASLESHNPPDCLLDERDGTRYGIVQIGNTFWMSENLKRSHPFNDVPGFRSMNASINRGLLYYWSPAICNICPEGWRLPHVRDWENLETALGFPKDKLNLPPEERLQIELQSKIGTFLKKKGDWDSDEIAASPSGFDALPEGFVNTCFFCTRAGITYSLRRNSPGLHRTTSGIFDACAIRCIKDQ